MIIQLKRGDTGIGRRAYLSNPKGNVDLTDADVLFKMGKHKIRNGRYFGISRTYYR